MNAEAFLADCRKELQRLKTLAEKAVEQAPEEAFFSRLDPESNSIAVLIKHVAGNLRSRWTNFLTEDGEKGWRNRDAEFEAEEGNDRRALMEAWEQGWATLFEALDSLVPEDMDRIVTIRDEPHTVSRAINRQLSHYAYHVGQIVLLAKHAAGDSWQSLSIPRKR